MFSSFDPREMLLLPHWTGSTTSPSHSFNINRDLQSGRLLEAFFKFGLQSANMAYNPFSA
jgi:hypothetical protein